MQLLHKKCIAAILIAGTLMFTGCGKLGENEAVELVKQNCKYPDSFKKIAYEVNEDVGLSHLDFKAKNMLGAEIPGRVYFTITKDRIQAIDTTDVPQDALEEFEKNSPQNFEKNVTAYKSIAKVLNEHKIDMEIFMNQYNNLNGVDNYFIWRNAANSTYQINKIIKSYKEAYDQAPEEVQKFFEKPMNYFRIIITGDFLNWNAQVERPTEYPDSENLIPQP